MADHDATPQLRGFNPNALTLSEAALLLTRSGGQPVTEEMLQADVAAGAPTNADGTINLLNYVALLVREMARGEWPAQDATQRAVPLVLLPSHGRYVGAGSLPFAEYSYRPGERVGHNWRMPNVKGCLSLFGDQPDQHIAGPSIRQNCLP
jgi:hypothetical protein